MIQLQNLKKSEPGREIMEPSNKPNQTGATIMQVTHPEANAGSGRRVIKLKDGWLEGQATVAPKAVQLT